MLGSTTPCSGRPGPGRCAAKSRVANDDTAYEGTANFTTAMTDQNRNVGIITKDPGVVGGIRSTIASDFAGAAPLTPGH